MIGKEDEIRRKLTGNQMQDREEEFERQGRTRQSRRVWGVWKMKTGRKRMIGNEERDREEEYNRERKAKAR
jgi:hypothetical protein